MVERAEAFCRLGDGALGTISATEFLPHAERNGLMRELTEGVIAQVLEERGSWSIPLPVAINLSQTNLFESDFSERVRALLARHATDPGLLTFELSDGFQDALSPEERDAMQQLAVAGVRFSLDGFDANRDEIPVLQITRLPLSELKIDARTLALDGSRNMALRRAMAFARDAQLDVVVKSVETTEQIAALRASGCTLVQGFAFVAPMNSGAFNSWLDQRLVV